MHQTCQESTVWYATPTSIGKEHQCLIWTFFPVFCTLCRMFSILKKVGASSVWPKIHINSGPIVSVEQIPKKGDFRPRLHENCGHTHKKILLSIYVIYFLKNIVVLILLVEE